MEPRPIVVLVKSVAAMPLPPLIVISFAFELKVILVPATSMVELKICPRFVIDVGTPSVLKKPIVS